jgi:hypothetical protein
MGSPAHTTAVSKPFSAGLQTLDAAEIVERILLPADLINVIAEKC